jgi:hypothetical protein
VVQVFALGGQIGDLWRQFYEREVTAARRSVLNFLETDWDARRGNATST